MPISGRAARLAEQEAHFASPVIITIRPISYASIGGCLMWGEKPFWVGARYSTGCDTIKARRKNPARHHEARSQLVSPA